MLCSNLKCYDNDSGYVRVIDIDTAFMISEDRTSSLYFCTPLCAATYLANDLGLELKDSKDNAESEPDSPIEDMLVDFCNENPASYNLIYPGNLHREIEELVARDLEYWGTREQDVVSNFGDLSAKIIEVKRDLLQKIVDNDYYPYEPKREEKNEEEK
jgi:hypothetical protein